MLFWSVGEYAETKANANNRQLPLVIEREEGQVAASVLRFFP